MAAYATCASRYRGVTRYVTYRVLIRLRSSIFRTEQDLGKLILNLNVCTTI